MITIEFGGAAETVTGSNFLVKSSRGTFIVDCGMFQGPDVEYRNLEDFNYDPSSVDFAVLTHAHLDHCGLFPKLVREGFSGKIYATTSTISLATEILLDSAKIQENNFKRGIPFGKFVDEVKLIYNSKDASDTISQFVSVNFRDTFEPVEGIKITFIRAGHVLGAASVEVEIDDVDGKRTILFSGDIGRAKEKIIDSYDLVYKSNPDYILLESLYGGMFHPPIEDSTQDLLNIVNETLERGGNVFIPSFALQRTQLLLTIFKHAKLNGSLDQDVHVWLDSPLAQRITNIYLKSLQQTDEPLFDFPNLHYVKKYKESIKLRKHKGQIIIAGSGMADGGRIVEHLFHGLKNKKNSVVFVGYQAEGTMGRVLVEGTKKVRIGTKNIPVNARIEYLHGFSAHGDTVDYENWLEPKKSDNLKKVFLIHAEKERAINMKNHLKDELDIANTYIPKWKEVVKLD
ncbi:MAG: MBL fold hydrolase [Candidatus Dojkabacteria bacterium]|nr:MAG: MBL fold hydrolase [Candidatus Dojkabacteria bacterium]